MTNERDPITSTEIVSYYDSERLLKEAVQQIEQFSEPHAVSLNVEADGRLIAIRPTRLEKVIKLARHFIAFLFSRVNPAKEKRLNAIKQRLSQAVDIVQSHSLLIEQMQEGKRITEIIHAFNKLLSNPTKKMSLSERYFERGRVLKDIDIRERQIRLPHTVSLKYEPVSNSHLAKKRLEEFGNLLQTGFHSEKMTALHSTHKKGSQVIKDAFRMKAISNIKQHPNIYSSISEIIPLIQKMPIEIDEDSSPSSIYLHQNIEIAPGSIVSMMGIFKKGNVNSKLMSIPLLEDFNFRLQSIQTGYPYPGQYALFAFCNPLVDVSPLREKQVPLFLEIDNRKKQIAQALLFDQHTINKAKFFNKQNREVFEKNKACLLDLHKNLQISIIKASSLVELTTEQLDKFDLFYKRFVQNEGYFDQLVRIQEQINQIAFILPAKKIQSEWLRGHQQLRTGTLKDRFIAASEMFKKERDSRLSSLEGDEDTIFYTKLMIETYGQGGQSIILQHMSEEIGFVPPMLTDFEQRIQASAFDQLITFLDEIESDNLEEAAENRAKVIEERLKKQIYFFEATEEEISHSPVWQIVEELEVYINSRFYTQDSSVIP